MNQLALNTPNSTEYRRALQHSGPSTFKRFIWPEAAQLQVERNKKHTHTLKSVLLHDSTCNSSYDRPKRNPFTSNGSTQITADKLEVCAVTLKLLRMRLFVFDCMHTSGYRIIGGAQRNRASISVKVNHSCDIPFRLVRPTSSAREKKCFDNCARFDWCVCVCAFVCELSRVKYPRFPCSTRREIYSRNVNNDAFNASSTQKSSVSTMKSAYTELKLEIFNSLVHTHTHTRTHTSDIIGNSCTIWKCIQMLRAEQTHPSHRERERESGKTTISTMEWNTFNTMSMGFGMQPSKSASESWQNGKCHKRTSRWLCMCISPPK